MLSKLNINEIYRFKEISYSHQGISNVFSIDNKKCYEKLSTNVFECMIKWDKIATIKV